MKPLVTSTTHAHPSYIALISKSAACSFVLPGGMCLLHIHVRCIFRIVVRNGGCRVGGCEELLLTLEPMTHVLQKQPHMHGLRCVSIDTHTAPKGIIYMHTHWNKECVMEPQMYSLLSLQRKPQCAWCCCSDVLFTAFKHGFSFSLHLHSFTAFREPWEQTDASRGCALCCDCRRQNPARSAGWTLCTQWNVRELF